MRHRRTKTSVAALREKSANLLRMASDCRDSWLSAELHRLAEEFMMRAKRKAPPKR